MRPAGSPAASPKPGTPPRPGFWVRTGGFPHPPDRASGPRKAGRPAAHAVRPRRQPASPQSTSRFNPTFRKIPQKRRNP